MGVLLFLQNLQDFCRILLKSCNNHIKNVKILYILQKILYMNLDTLNKVQKIFPFFRKSENSDQSFIMVIYEKLFF